MINKLEHNVQTSNTKLSITHVENINLKKKIDEFRRIKFANNTILKNLVSVDEISFFLKRLIEYLI